MRLLRCLTARRCRCSACGKDLLHRTFHTAVRHLWLRDIQRTSAFTRNRINKSSLATWRPLAGLADSSSGSVRLAQAFVRHHKSTARFCILLPQPSRLVPAEGKKSERGSHSEADLVQKSTPHSYSQSLVLCRFSHTSRVRHRTKRCCGRAADRKRSPTEKLLSAGICTGVPSSGIL